MKSVLVSFVVAVLDASDRHYKILWTTLQNKTSSTTASSFSKFRYKCIGNIAMQFRVVLLLLFLVREWNVAEADCSKKLYSNSTGVTFSNCILKKYTEDSRLLKEPEITPITCEQTYVFEEKKCQWFNAPDDVEYIEIVSINISRCGKVIIENIVDSHDKGKILNLTREANGEESVTIKLKPPDRKFRIKATDSTATTRFMCKKECTSITCAQGYVFEETKDEWFDAPDDVEYIAIVGIKIPEGVTVTIHNIVDFENKGKILKLTSKANDREKIIIKLEPPHRMFKISSTKPTAIIKFFCNKVRECTKMNEENERIKRIVRGKATDKNEYPFMARILTLWSKTKDNYTDCNEDNETDVNKIFKKCNNNVNGTKGACGGSIINNRWVLSAAHCFIEPGIHLIGVLVFLGDHLIKEKDGEKVYWVSTKATDLITHPDYPKDTYSDIALLQVDRNIDLDKEKCYPICLAPLNMDDLVGCKVHTAGWGQTEKKQLSDELRKEKDGPFEIFEDAVCRDNRPDHIICFKHEETNACSGDSGGPLFCDSANDFYYEVGVLESVMNATKENAGDIWEKGGRQQAVKVTSFLKWINDNAGYLP